MAYTTIPPMNGSGFPHLLTWVNDASGGILGLTLAIITFILVFAGMSAGSNTRDALPASLLITTIMCILFYSMGILPLAFLIGMAVATGLSGLMAWKS